MNQKILIIGGLILVFGAMVWDRSKKLEEAAKKESDAEEKRKRDRDRVRRNYGLGR